MVSAIIDYHREMYGDEEEFEVNVYPEAHYDHYGTRGAADLYIEALEDTARPMGDEHVFRKTERWSYLYEVKSEYAVKQATGANEILRQFTRMRDYFFKDDQYDEPDHLHLELCFLPTPVTWEHVRENESIYREVEGGDGNTNVHQVTFRVPDGDYTPLAPFKSSFESMDEALELMRPDFREYVES